jgi:transcriptional regulator NrdR family protein
MQLPSCRFLLLCAQLNSFSTSTLPGASSILWEFRAADQRARKRYAAAYRKFKDSLEIGED